MRTENGEEPPQPVHSPPVHRSLKNGICSRTLHFFRGTPFEVVFFSLPTRLCPKVMSESGGHVVVLAATNDIERLDPALLRPGRLDRRVHLGIPDAAARTAIFLQRLLDMPLKMEEDGEGGGEGGARSTREGRGLLGSTEAYAEWLAGETEGRSGAQVTGVCREAALAALREGIGAAEVAPRHFEAALGGQRGGRTAVFAVGRR